MRERGSAQAWARELARGGLERCLACAQAWERVPRERGLAAGSERDGG